MVWQDYLEYLLKTIDATGKDLARFKSDFLMFNAMKGLVRWFVWKNLLLGSSCQAEIARKLKCSKQYVNAVCIELERQGVVFKEKNRIIVKDRKKLLFMLACDWKLPEPLVLSVPLHSREGISEFFDRIGVKYAFTCDDWHVWVDDASRLKQFKGGQGISVYINPFVASDSDYNHNVNAVQKFCDLFSRGGKDLDVALSFARDIMLI